MKLIKCPACGHDVSDQALSCPNCGQPLNSITQPQSDAKVAVSELPEFSQATRVPSRVKFYYLVIIVLVIALCTLPTTIFHHWASFFWGFFILIGVPFWIFLSLEVSSTRFEIHEKELVVSRGILAKRSTSLPFNNIQNIGIGSGLLLNLFKLNKVAFWSSSPSQIVIRDGRSENVPDAFLILAKADAEKIRSFILKMKTV